MRHVICTGFSVDLALCRRGLLGSDTVMAMSENRATSCFVRTIRRGRNYRYFRSFDKFGKVSHSQFTTVQAKMMLMAAAFDPASGQFTGPCQREGEAVGGIALRPA
jgi:hypothetical protein